MSSNPSKVEFNISATYSNLSSLEEPLQQFITRHIQHCDDQSQYDISLAMDEICTNIIDHAYGPNQIGEIEISFSLCDNPYGMEIELTDTGRSFEFDSAVTPDLNKPQVRGYGLFLVNQLMDGVTYSTCDTHNKWLLTKFLPPDTSVD